jgi:TonB family protein
MYSPLPAPRFTSTLTSFLVHAAVIGIVLLISGPVWKSIPTRSVTKLAAPPRLTPLALKRKPLIRRAAKAPPAIALPAPPAPTTPVTRKLQPPSPARIPVRLELSAENPVTTVVPMPTISAPAINAKSLVQTGLLDHPAAASSSAPRAAVSSGFDTGDTASKSSAGRRVTGTGFDGDTSGTLTKVQRPLATVGFDQVESAKPAAAQPQSSPFEGIEILEKPQPVYTEEARRLKIEGTVKLRVLFSATGQIHVLSVVKGLGYGLDEAAMRAAQSIRFRPARRDGHPVDAPAVIQIQFQIA